MNFKHVGEANTLIEFLPNDSCEKEGTPGVYIWLLKQRESMGRIFYIGKAGNGILTRMSQHKGGLKKYPTRAARICALLEKNNDVCFEVWFRKSFKGSTEVSDNLVSFYSVEEEALIERFSPELNQAKPPSIRNRTVSYLQEIGDELQNSSSEQGELWRDAIDGMDNSSKRKLENAFKLLFNSNYLTSRSESCNMKIVRSYTSVPLSGRPLLVFGKMADINITHKKFWISLDGMYIAFPPGVAFSATESEGDGSFKLGYFLKNTDKFNLAHIANDVVELIL